MSNNGHEEHALIRRLTSRLRKIHQVNVPEWDDPVGLVRLTRQEEHDAQLAAHDLFAGKAIDLVLADAYDAELSVQILARALVYPEHLSDGQLVRIFKDPKQLRKLCSGSELEFLIVAYNEHPDQDLWERLKKAGGIQGVARALQDPPVGGSAGSGR